MTPDVLESVHEADAFPPADIAPPPPPPAPNGSHVDEVAALLSDLPAPSPPRFANDVNVVVSVLTGALRESGTVIIPNRLEPPEEPPDRP